MPKTKTLPEVSVRIPTVIAAKYRLRSGDAFDIRDFEGCILIIPNHAKKMRNCARK